MKKKLEWYQKHPQYPTAIRLARMLIRKELANEWNAEFLASYLVRPLARMNRRPKKPARTARGEEGK